MTVSWELAIVDGDASSFATVRGALKSAGFNEGNVCERFGLEGMVDFKSVREGRVLGTRVGDALETFTDLLMDLADVDEATARLKLGDDVVDALLTLGLVRNSPQSADALQATMLLYPVGHVVLTSDKTFGREGDLRPLPADIVYPSVTRSATTFMRMLPSSPCDAFLEMCAGNGIAALSAANRATHSWSLDIADRATRVAHFNAKLNGFDNVTCLQGDLYEPVRGKTFDCIVAHPPYVPSFEQRLLYRDGGPDGEHITRRIVSELPTYLRPGGRFWCTCIATDRTNAAIQHRMREWLGDARDEFDIIVSVTSAEHPSEHYFKRAINGAIPFADAERRHHAFKDMQVELIVFMSFVIERHPSPRSPATVRLNRSAGTSGIELEQLCNWLSARSAPDLFQRMLAAYPKIAPDSRLRQMQVLQGDKWKPGELEFETTWPFIATLHCPADVTQLLARCDGRRTTRQIIAWLRQKGLLSSSAPDRAVLDTLANCIAVGAIFLEERSE